MVKKFVTDGVLQHNTMYYPFQLESISMTGMVVKLKWETSELLLPGGECELICYNNPEYDSVTISAQIVHYSFSLVALQFGGLDKESEHPIAGIIEKFASEKIERTVNSSVLHHLHGPISLK